MVKQCLVPNCEKNMYAKHLCRNHYTYFRKHFPMKTVEEFVNGGIYSRKDIKKEKCLIDRCRNEGRLKGLCRKHYHTYYSSHQSKSIEQYVSYVNNRPDYQKNPDECIIYGCTDKGYCKGLCNKHYTSFKSTYINESLENFIKIKNRQMKKKELNL
ncbi:hypothetical protein [Heyndrickxia ginsengihumi]|uniref:hypothetical protein n=1 Tax=Heyndrickxia ginsengihumi TaxID=363870 RepID=UPI00046EDB6A|nr:hypothetical protein [Heyndrickxia ginsengihumi]